jgi:CHAT domain-containing protein
VLGTLWNIQDENNSLLLADFYRAVAKSVPPVQALRDMQLAAIHRGALGRAGGSWSAFEIVVN